MFRFFRKDEILDKPRGSKSFEGNVGSKGICPSGEPIKDEIPLEQLMVPVKPEHRYGSTTGAE